MERTCIFAECDEPATKELPLTWGPVTRRFDICSEHFHDIDWGVISLDDVVSEARLRGLLDRLTLLSGDATHPPGLHVTDDVNRSFKGRSAS